jgi:ATP-dependent exoDNAse (exonuclease V) alpha subunit
VAIYHYSQKPVARRKGQSAVAGAAYRSAQKLYDQRLDQTWDYLRRKGVVHAEIVLPTQAARRDITWARDRQNLWNAAEAAEKRKDARVAREHEVALPHELSKVQQIALLREFSSEIANRYNVAVDFALHRPHRQGNARNFHAHIYTTTREIEPSGLGAKSSIELSDTDRYKRGLASGRKEITFMRERWELAANEHLLAHGIEARIDARSLADQGIEREPTTHLGPAVSGMERRGIATEVGKRIELEGQVAAKRRLAHGAELTRLAREGLTLERSILELSARLAAVRAMRSHEGPERGQSIGWDDLEARRLAAAQAWAEKHAAHPPASVEELQQQGREAWLKLRAEQLEREKAQGQEPDLEQERDDQEARRRHEREIDRDIGEDLEL